MKQGLAMNYKKMSYVSGGIILLGVLIILLAINWLSKGELLFSHSYILLAEFSEVNGLQKQSPVQLRGYRIGQVKDFMLRREAVVVRLSVDREVQIPAGSTFTVSAVNMIGEKGISITPPDSFGQYLQEGDTVRGTSQDFLATLNRVANNLSQAVESGDFQRLMTRLGQSADNVQSILAKLDGKIDQIDVADLNRQVAQIGEAGRQAKVLLASTQPEIMEVTRDSRMTVNKLGQVTDSISTLVASIQGLSDRIATGHGTAAQLLNSDATVNKLNAAIDQLHSLLADVQANPRKYIRLSIF